MDHDITHCRGIDCPIKNTCYRYLAHKEALNEGLTHLTYLVQNKENLEKQGRCDIYWPTKKYYGDDDSRPE